MERRSHSGDKSGVSVSGHAWALLNDALEPGGMSDLEPFLYRVSNSNPLVALSMSYRQILVMARPVRRRRLWADGQVWR